MINDVLQDIQFNLKAPKSQFNSFGNYNYRNCEDILNAVKSLAAKHKATVILDDDIKAVGDRIYIVATATLSCGDEHISVHAYAREPASKKGMDESQITGAASSYARKYALNGLFAIDDTKDSDELPPEQPNAPTGAPNKRKPKYVCKKCKKEIVSVVKDGKNVLASEVYEKCGGLCTDCYKAVKREQREQSEQSNG